MNWIYLCVCFFVKGIMAGKSEIKRKTDESTITDIVNEMRKFVSHGTILGCWCCRYPYGPVKLVMNALIILLCVKRDDALQWAM